MPENKEVFAILEPAFFWRCPNCRKKNFESSVPIEWTDNDLREFMGLEPWESVTDEHREELDCYSAPVNVKCDYCKKKYKAIDNAVLQDDEEDLEDLEGDEE